MKTPIYTDCKTAHTGIYKPNTICLDNSYAVSIVYWDINNLHRKNLCAIAIDTDGNRYQIHRTENIYGSIGFLAFPENAKKIKGLDPYL